MKTVGFRVTGRVQGVGYRTWTLREGRRLGLRGWVRNLQDGAVEGVAQGDAEQVDAMLLAMKRGPMHAVVARVRFIEVAPLETDAFHVWPTAGEPAFPLVD